MSEPLQFTRDELVIIETALLQDAAYYKKCAMWHTPPDDTLSSMAHRASQLSVRVSDEILRLDTERRL